MHRSIDQHESVAASSSSVEVVNNPQLTVPTVFAHAKAEKHLHEYLRMQQLQMEKRREEERRLQQEREEALAQEREREKQRGLMEKLKDNHKKVIGKLYSSKSGVKYNDDLTPDMLHRKSTADKKTKKKKDSRD